MCLILFAYNAHPRYRLILGANRDEFYARPTAPLDFWPDHPHVLAGRDLEQNGTWMGITRQGRLSAITNFRNPRAVKSGTPSRGSLVAGFLMGQAPPADYIQQIAAEADRYNGFNLIVGDSNRLIYFSNQEHTIHELGAGIYGLSNHLLDTPWPKVLHGKQQLADHLDTDRDISSEAILEILQDQMPAPDDRLPETGLDRAWERMLSPMFITSPAYGTRCSSVLIIDAAGHIRFTERTWTPAQPVPREQFTRQVELP